MRTGPAGLTNGSDDGIWSLVLEQHGASALAAAAGDAPDGGI